MTAPTHPIHHAQPSYDHSAAASCTVPCQIFPYYTAIPRHLAARKYARRKCCASMNHEGREIRTPNLLIWNQTRCRCAIPPWQHVSLQPTIHHIISHYAIFFYNMRSCSTIAYPTPIYSALIEYTQNYSCQCIYYNITRVR